MKLKELIKQIKAVFELPANTATDPANQVPADTSNATVYTLQDGTQIAIQQAGDVPAPGDTVTVSGAPAPEGILTLQDGSTITCDANGVITLYTPVGGDPITTVVPAADATAKPPAVPAAVPVKTPVAGVPGKTGYSEIDKAYLLAAFDTATGTDLMTNLVTCVKALMQSEFGWQILEQQRLADTNAAIAVYKTTLQAASQKQTALEKTITEQKGVIDKHEATIKGMFEILEQVVEMPTAEPKTLTGNKRDGFEAGRKKTEDKFSKMADSLKEVKEAANA